MHCPPTACSSIFTGALPELLQSYTTNSHHIQKVMDVAQHLALPPLPGRSLTLHINNRCWLCMLLHLPLHLEGFQHYTAPCGATYLYFQKVFGVVDIAH